MTETQRRIRAARAYSGMTLDELAERVGIGRMTLYRMENGQRDVKRMELREIAEACDLPAEFFTAEWATLADGAGRLDRIEDKLDRLLDHFKPRATGEALEVARQGALDALGALGGLQPQDTRKTA